MTKNSMNQNESATMSTSGAGNAATVIEDFGMEDRLMTAADLAEHLGVSTKTIYNWRAQIPVKGPVGFVLSGSVRYYASDVQRWVKDQYDTSKSGTS
jgi:predicted DNA-binding transcriptional regulator AlpA